MNGESVEMTEDEDEKLREIKEFILSRFEGSHILVAIAVPSEDGVSHYIGTDGKVNHLLPMVNHIAKKLQSDAEDNLIERVFGK